MRRVGLKSPIGYVQWMEEHHHHICSTVLQFLSCPFICNVKKLEDEEERLVIHSHIRLFHQVTVVSLKAVRTKCRQDACRWGSISRCYEQLFLYKPDIYWAITVQSNLKEL